MNGTFIAACLADGAKSQKRLPDAKAQREVDKALQAVCNNKLLAENERLKKASEDAKVAADAAYSAAVAAAEAAATKQCADAKTSIAKDELRKAAIIPTANRYTMEYAASPTCAVLPGPVRSHKGGMLRHCTSGAAQPAKRVWFSRQQRASSLRDGQVLRRGSSYRQREGGAATQWFQGRRALRPSRRQCDARDAEPLPPQKGSLCQVQAAHLRQPERFPPDSYAPAQRS